MSVPMETVHMAKSLNWERTNQNARIDLKTTLPCSNLEYFAMFPWQISHSNREQNQTINTFAVIINTFLHSVGIEWSFLPKY